MDWQPIETAPKDETRFLGVNAGGSIYWPSVYHFVWETEEGPMWSMADEFFETNLTHWMPLPEPPK